MGFFDFMDGRIGIVRWAVKWFKVCRESDPNIPDRYIIEHALAARYSLLPLVGKENKLYFEERRSEINCIHDLCLFVICLELNPKYHSSIESMSETVKIIDKELKKHGF